MNRISYLDCCNCKHDFSSSIYVRVHNTKNVLKLFWNDQRLQKKKKINKIVNVKINVLHNLTVKMRTLG